MADLDVKLWGEEIGGSVVFLALSAFLPKITGDPPGPSPKSATGNHGLTVGQHDQTESKMYGGKGPRCN